MESFVWMRYEWMMKNALTSWAALAQVFLSALSTVLTQQLVVAHQQLHRGKLVETGLDRALPGAGYVAVGERLKGPLVVMMQVLSALCFSLFFWRTVWRTMSRREAEIDLWHCRYQLLYTATSPHARRCRGGSGRWCRRQSQGGSGRWCQCVPVAERRGTGAPLALWSLTVSIIATVLGAGVSLTAIWEVACCHHPAGWHT